jgi:hypothetical protein
MSKRKTFKAGDLKIEVWSGDEGAPYTRSTDKEWDVIIDFGVPPGNEYHAAQERSYLLMDVIAGRLAQAGYQLKPSYKFDLGSEQRVLPVDKVKANGETLTREALEEIVEGATKAFTKAVYPTVQAAQESSATQRNR